MDRILTTTSSLIAAGVRLLPLPCSSRRPKTMPSSYRTPRCTPCRRQESWTRLRCWSWTARLPGRQNRQGARRGPDHQGGRARGLSGDDQCLGKHRAERDRLGRSHERLADMGNFKPQLLAFSAVHPASEMIPIARVNGITTALSAPRAGSLPARPRSCTSMAGPPMKWRCSKSAGMVMALPSAAEDAADAAAAPRPRRRGRRPRRPSGNSRSTNCPSCWREPVIMPRRARPIRRRNATASWMHWPRSWPGS